MTPATKQFPAATQGLPAAAARALVELADGDVFDLVIAPLVKRIGDHEVRMLAYNGSVPGPTIKVRQGSRVTVNATNRGDTDTTVHWHGLRLDNRYDGTPEVQPPIAVGQSFEYALEFPDPGIYWYHPHIRQDHGQEMGLYGNILVVPEDPGYWPPADRDVLLTLDDVLIEGGRIAPFHPAYATHAAMGRFGNRMLVGGETEVQLAARPGEVVRLYLTNTANTRVFDFAVGGARMKLVGGDSGRHEHERFVESVIVAPSERVVVDVRFDTPGEAALEHRTPARTYRLGAVRVAGDAVRSPAGAAFEMLRTNPELAAERERLTAYLDAEPDKIVALVAELDVDAAHDHDAPAHPAHHVHEHGGAAIEWEDGMAELNRATTSQNTRWKLVDRATGAAGAGIDWRFQVGDHVKIRLVNELESDHPMHHPFHIHGAGRFLVLARDGLPEDNLVWSDTVLSLPGEELDLLLDVTHAGRWMAHCHIAEHHESGMVLSFDVDPPEPRGSSS